MGEIEYMCKKCILCNNVHGEIYQRFDRFFETEKGEQGANEILIIELCLGLCQRSIILNESCNILSSFSTK